MSIHLLQLRKAVVVLSCALAWPYFGADLYANQNANLVDKDSKLYVQGERGHRGYRGQQGHTGDRGKRGHTGSTGSTGPIGPIGPAGPVNGLSAFAGAVLIEPALSPLLTVASGVDIPFPITTVTPNNINLVGTTGFQVVTAGTYEITYGVESAAAVLMDVGIAINGTVNADTVVAPVVAVTAVSGTFIIPLAASDTITIRNTSLLALTLNAAPSVGAFITVKKLN